MTKATIRVLCEPPVVHYTITIHSYTVVDRDALDRCVRAGWMSVRSVETEPWCDPPVAAGKSFTAHLVRCPVADHDLILARMTEVLAGRGYTVETVDRAAAQQRLQSHVERIERERGYAQALLAHYERCADKARRAAVRADKRLQWCAEHSSEPEDAVRRLDFGSLPRELRA